MGHMQYEQPNLITRKEVCRRGVYCMCCLRGRGRRDEGMLLLSQCFRGLLDERCRLLSAGQKLWIPDSTHAAT